MKQNQYIGVKIDEEMKQKLGEYAKETFRSRSGVVKHALKTLWEDDKPRES